MTTENDTSKWMSHILGDALTDAIDLTRELENAPPAILGLKLAEECGEFSEALSKELGFLQHKETKEPLLGEAADVIIVVLATLVMTYPDRSLQDITRELRDHIIMKNQKYRNILEAHRER